jgi:hypothetical protein
VALDNLLLRLGVALPVSLVRAYADDVASVCVDMDVAAPLLHGLVADFGRISSFHFNLPKPRMILLFLGDRKGSAGALCSSTPAGADSR